MFPEPIQKLIQHFQKLPGIGPKQGARFAFRLLAMSQHNRDAFSRAIADVKKHTAVCAQCFLSFSRNGTDSSLCHFCRNPSRNSNIICVVERDQDATSIEQSGAYNGLYHILKNARNPSGSLQEAHPTVQGLQKRISSTKNGEVIIATSATTGGQEQYLALKSILADHNVTLTRLGRGLSSGTEIEYADPDTLTDAFETRQ